MLLLNAKYTKHNYVYASEMILIGWIKIGKYTTIFDFDAEFKIMLNKKRMRDVRRGHPFNYNMPNVVAVAVVVIIIGGQNGEN